MQITRDQELMLIGSARSAYAKMLREQKKDPNCLWAEIEILLNDLADIYGFTEDTLG